MSTIKELVARAHAAQEQIEYWSQEQVDEMVAAVGWHALQAAEAWFQSMQLTGWRLQSPLRSVLQDVPLLWAGEQPPCFTQAW